jgi:hypothetical protein
LPALDNPKQTRAHVEYYEREMVDVRDKKAKETTPPDFDAKQPCIPRACLPRAK